MNAILSADEVAAMRANAERLYEHEAEALADSHETLRVLAHELASFIRTAAGVYYEPGCPCESCQLIDKAATAALLA